MTGKGGKQPRVSRRAKIEARRREVTEMLLAGATETAIAARLKVSQPTVSRDVTAVRREWAERRSEAYESKLALDFGRSEAALGAIWDRVLAGHNLTIDRLVSLLTYRAKLLGVPEKQGSADLSSELGTLLAQAAAELAAKEQDADAASDVPHV